MLAIGRGTLHAERREAGCLDLPPQRVHVERLVHRVARLRMRQVEREQRRGRQAVARAAERDPRVGERLQLRPRVLFDGVAHAEIPIQSFAPASSGTRDVAARNAPCASAISIVSSHSSNSGARRRPSTSRTYSWSWNDVLW